MLSKIYEFEDLSVSGELLSEAEIAFFKENGFLVKKQLVKASLAREALQHTWEYVLERIPVDSDSGWRLKPEDPATWVGPRWGPMSPADKSGFFEGRQRIFHMRSAIKVHDIGDADFVLDLLPNNPAVREVGERFLGSLKSSERTRGVYALFPLPEEHRLVSADRLGPHTDRVCQQLNLCTYLEDVGPRSGGFTIYPGSHKLMYKAHDYAANWSPNESFEDATREVVRTIQPVELVADVGDVIFWHGRLVHTAGIHASDEIRWAVFGDYTEDRPIHDDDEHRALGQYEWFKDAKLFVEDSRTSNDMWEDWNI